VDVWRCPLGAYVLKNVGSKACDLADRTQRIVDKTRVPRA
jgi:hypothetical protein